MPAGWQTLDCDLECCESGSGDSGSGGNPVFVPCCPTPISRTLYMTFGAGCQTTLGRAIGPCTIPFYYDDVSGVWETLYQVLGDPFDADASGCPVNGVIDCVNPSFLFRVNTGFFVGGGGCSFEPFGSAVECPGGICGFTTEICDPFFLESTDVAGCTVTVTE